MRLLDWIVVFICVTVCTTLLVYPAVELVTRIAFCSSSLPKISHLLLVD
jgi:hypothetical protein